MNQDVWMNYGMGEFHMEKIIHISNCETCKSTEGKIVDFVIHDCLYKIDGELQQPRRASIIKEGRIKKEKIKSLEQGNTFIWRYLKLNVSPPKQAFLSWI